MASIKSQQISSNCFKTGLSVAHVKEDTYIGCGTFTHAKDQASLPLDGLLEENPTPCCHD
jgi:hypothetical protein